jgi:hypothetical protein
MLDKKQKGYKSACTLYKRKQLRQQKKHKKNCFRGKNRGWEHNNYVEANLKERWMRIEQRRGT